MEVEGLPDRLLRPCAGLRAFDEPCVDDGPGRIDCLLVAITGPHLLQVTRKLATLAGAGLCRPRYADSG